MDEHEVALYRTLIRWGAAIILALIASVAIYNYLDVAGPVRPKMTQQYYWPK